MKHIPKPPSTRSIIKEITYNAKERDEIFTNLDLDRQIVIFLRLSRHVQGQLLSELKKETILPILEHLDPDDATDALQTLSKKRQKDLLADFSEELQNKVSLLLQFDPRTAAGLMSLNYIQVDLNQKL